MSSKRKWVSPIDDGTYSSWYAMRRRCAGKDTNSRYYVGVRVCREWEDFDQFYKDIQAAGGGRLDTSSLIRRL